jgi:4-hydroxy-tetrahydrodipicolinate synthase
VYNVPSRTGLNINSDTAKELSRIDNIVALKEASGNFTQIGEIASYCGNDLFLYSGNDDQVVPILSLGGKGVISVAANIIPKDVHDMVASFLDGNVEESRRLQLKMMNLVKALFIEVSPMPVKAALNLIGFNVGKCRLPLVEMTEKNLDFLKTELKNYGFNI